MRTGNVPNWWDRRCCPHIRYIHIKVEVYILWSITYKVALGRSGSILAYILCEEVLDLLGFSLASHIPSWGLIIDVFHSLLNPFLCIYNLRSFYILYAIMSTYFIDFIQLHITIIENLGGQIGKLFANFFANWRQSASNSNSHSY
jgi:hypothetical protein